MLILHRVVKTFRLGSHPAPLIPVDVVSRAIVHSALGWGGPLTAPAVQQVLSGDQRSGAPVPDDLSLEELAEYSEASPEGSCMSDLGESKGVVSGTGSVAFGASSGMVAGSRTEGLPHSSNGSNVDTEMVSIRNVAWATHKQQFSPRCDSPVEKGTVPEVRTRGKDPSLGAHEDGHSSSGGGDTDGVPGEGRMPSFQEFSSQLYDYAVLRGLRPSLEALAVRASFSLIARASSYGPDLDGVRGSASLKSWGFIVVHHILDRIPLLFLRGIAICACRLRCWLLREDPWRRPSTPPRAFRGKDGLASIERLDRLAALPVVYEPFTWRQYFFDSALRVPVSLTPEGYTFETALTSEMFLQNV